MKRTTAPPAGVISFAIDTAPKFVTGITQGAHHNPARDVVQKK